ncbi:MAG: hypothetical protein ACXWOH_12470, partial [Bdellovibrionota bacterium]
RFAQIAELILKRARVARGERRFRVSSLELYLHHHAHKDPWTDCAQEQLTSGRWYVFVRGVRYSRIDLTAGSKAAGIFASLLIRGIDGDDGSSKALRTLVRQDASPASAKPAAWSEEERKFLTVVQGASVWESAELRLIEGETLAGAVSLVPRVFKTPKGHEMEQLALRAVLRDGS